MNPILEYQSQHPRLTIKTDVFCLKCQIISMLVIIFLGSFAVLYLLYTLPHFMSKSDFQIVSASSYEHKDSIVIDADLKMDFPAPVVEALENGIPLTIAVEAQVLLEQSWWRNVIVKDSRKLFELRYHPLTNVHEVKNIATNERYSFDSRQDAMAVLGTIRGAQLMAQKELLKNYQYNAQLRIMLDISRLPSALRQVASLSPSWRLESSWYRWKIEPQGKAPESLEHSGKVDLLSRFKQGLVLPEELIAPTLGKKIVAKPQSGTKDAPIAIAVEQQP